MNIDRKYALNKRRLTKREVNDILATNPPLEAEISKLFEWTWATDGYVQRNKLFRLPEDKYLYVYDPKDISVPGRGDIFPKKIITRLVEYLRRKDFYYENGLNSSFDYWKFYTKLGTEIITKAGELRLVLAKQLKIPIEALNYSYKSLDLINEKLNPLNVEFISENYIDCLCSYVGEVLLRRVSGHWAITEKELYLDEIPFISIDIKNIFYNPVNVLFSCLNSLEDIDLRKETANEVRSQSSRLAYEKHMAQFREL